MRQSFGRRLVRLEEALAKKREDEARHRERMKEICDRFAEPPSSVERWIFDPFKHWFGQNFAPIPDGAAGLDYVLERLETLEKAGLFKYLARKELESWWGETFPDKGPLDDRFKATTPYLVSKLKDRIFDETIGGLVPLEHQQYFIDPDRWIIGQRQGPPKDGESASLCFFRLLIRPAGGKRQRAGHFAKAWQMVPLLERTIQPWTPVLENETPLAWLQRTISEQADASAA